MLEHELPQQVIVICAGFSQPALTKADMTKRIEAGRDAQRVRRQLAFKAILTADIKLGVMPWGHVKTAVPELMKLPVAACVLRCKSLGHGEDGRLQFDDVTDAEKFIHEGHALGLGDDVGD